MGPVIHILDNFINLISRGWINAIITVYHIHEVIDFLLGRTKHVFIDRIECDERGNIVCRTYIINGDRKHSSDENIGYRTVCLPALRTL